MSLALENRNASFKLSKPEFNRQERIVLNCIGNGLIDPESISNYSGELLTSIRRAVTNLKQRGEIEEDGSVMNQSGTRNITAYKIREFQLTFLN